MARYRGVVESHVAIKSKNKGTPGIEFRIILREEKRGTDWTPIQWRERRCTVWFPPGGNHSFAMKKLAFAGFAGGSLQSLALEGRTVEVQSEIETYEGKEYEKFDLALPPRASSAPDGDAFLAIDAILTSTPVEKVETPEQLDPAAKQPENVPATPEAPAGGTPDRFEDAPTVVDDDLPF